MRLQISGVGFHYKSHAVLDDVSLSIETGQVLSLTGPNGSGKTTLLKCINRILHPKRGAVLMDHSNIDRMNLKELARALGYVPQSAPASFPLTVFDAVVLGRRPHVNWKLGERDKEVAFEVLKSMKLDDMALRLFNELSGGEKQKVLIARALCQEPQVLLLDEPTSNLDLRRQLEVLDLLSNLIRERGLCAIMAMHDLNLAARYSTQVAMLKNGSVFAVGSPAKILRKEVIKEVYGVLTEVKNDTGYPYIIPLAPVDAVPERDGKEERSLPEIPD